MKEQEKKPILIYQKNADKEGNRVILPKEFIDRYGRVYFMEIYEDEIRLKPVKKEGE